MVRRLSRRPFRGWAAPFDGHDDIAADGHLGSVDHGQFDRTLSCPPLVLAAVSRAHRESPARPGCRPADPSLRAMSGLSDTFRGCRCTGSHSGRRRSAPAATSFARLMGMARPTPERYPRLADDLGVDADDLSAPGSAAGPPEFPGLVAASCCTTRGTEKLLSVGLIVLPHRADDAGSHRKAAARTGLRWQPPTGRVCMLSLSPTCQRPAVFTESSTILITARSESGSSPTTSASACTAIAEHDHDPARLRPSTWLVGDDVPLVIPDETRPGRPGTEEITVAAYPGGMAPADGYGFQHAQPHHGRAGRRRRCSLITSSSCRRYRRSPSTAASVSGVPLSAGCSMAGTASDSAACGGAVVPSVGRRRPPC